MIGEEVRQQLEATVAKYDPFNVKREKKYKFKDKPMGGPFQGLTVEILERFIENKKKEYNQKY